MKFKILCVFTFIILISSIGIVSASHDLNETISTVDTNNTIIKSDNSSNSLNHNNEREGTFEDIQNSVDKAKDNEIIELNGTYVSTGNGIYIDKPLTINGNNAVLDAKQMKYYNVINLQAPSLVLKNIKFINAQPTVICCHDSKVTLINCTFTSNGGNIDSDDALILWAKNSSVSIFNSTFENNRNDNDGLLYELIQLENAVLECINTTFDNNNMNIINANDKSNIILEGLTFKDNSAEYITQVYSRGDVTVINCSFADNMGSAINCYKNLEIENTKFINNSASAIFYYGADVRIKNSTFSSNRNQYAGGAIDGYGRLIVEGCNFTDNVGIMGTAIHSEHYWDVSEMFDNRISLINSSIDCKKDNDYGIYATCCDIDLINSTVSTKSNKMDIYIDVGSLNNVSSVYGSYGFKDKINAEIQISPASLTRTYNSDEYLFIGVVNSRNAVDLPYAKIIVKIYTGKKYITYYLKPKYVLDGDEVGLPFIKIDSRLSVGKHKVEIISNGKYFSFKKYTTTLTVKKAKTIVKAHKVTFKYKKSKYFKATIKNKSTKKFINGVKVKVKVYTGKKYKSYILKTNKKGLIKLNTKKLKKGKHKVIITSANKNYSINAKSLIKIKR